MRHLVARLAFTVKAWKALLLPTDPATRVTTRQKLMARRLSSLEAILSVAAQLESRADAAVQRSGIGFRQWNLAKTTFCRSSCTFELNHSFPAQSVYHRHEQRGFDTGASVTFGICDARIIGTEGDRHPHIRIKIKITIR